MTIPRQALDDLRVAARDGMKQVDVLTNALGDLSAEFVRLAEQNKKLSQERDSLQQRELMRQRVSEPGLARQHERREWDAAVASMLHRSPDHRTGRQERDPPRTGPERD